MIVGHFTPYGGEKQTKNKSKVGIYFFVQTISMLKFPWNGLKCTKFSLFLSTNSKERKFKSFWSILFELKRKGDKYFFCRKRHRNEAGYQRAVFCNDLVRVLINFQGELIFTGRKYLQWRVTPRGTINYLRVLPIVFYLRPLTTIRSLF